MPTNDFLTFAAGADANVISQAAYAALAAQDTGFAGGTVALSAELNKVWRQSGFIAAVLAQFISENGVDTLDDGDLAGMVAKLRAAISASFPRQKLVAPKVLQVAPTGSDTTGDGSAAAPFRTIQHAFDFASSTFDFAGRTVTIQLADATYNAGLIAAGQALGAIDLTPVVIQGNAANPANVIVNIVGADCLVAQNGVGILVKDMTLTSTIMGGAGGYCLRAEFGGVLDFQNLRFLNASSAHLFSTRGGHLKARGNYSVLASAPMHAFCSLGSYLELSSLAVGGANNITIGAGLNFSQAFAWAEVGGIIMAPTCTFPGASATGKRFTAVMNGVINANGQGMNYFPGSIDGTPTPATDPIYGNTGGVYH